MPLTTTNLIPFAQWAAVTAPTVYAGITYQYSQTMDLLVATTPPSTPTPLALHWLALYQSGPQWVLPLVLASVFSNLFLLSAPATPHPFFHLASALLTLSIMPFTLFHMERGVNGACKIKAAGLLYPSRDGDNAGEGKREKGVADVPVVAGGVLARFSGVSRHSADESGTRWAEREGMHGLVRSWARWNHGRWVIGAVAGGVAFWGVVG